METIALAVTLARRAKTNVDWVWFTSGAISSKTSHLTNTPLMMDTFWAHPSDRAWQPLGAGMSSHTAADAVPSLALSQPPHELGSTQFEAQSHQIVPDLLTPPPHNHSAALTMMDAAYGG